MEREAAEDALLATTNVVGNLKLVPIPAEMEGCSNLSLVLLFRPISIYFVLMPEQYSIGKSHL